MIDGRAGRAARGNRLAHGEASSITHPHSHLCNSDRCKTRGAESSTPYSINESGSFEMFEVNRRARAK